jgi:hypothetical protein
MLLIKKVEPHSFKLLKLCESKRIPNQGVVCQIKTVVGMIFLADIRNGVANPL